MFLFFFYFWFFFIVPLIYYPLPYLFGVRRVSSRGGVSGIFSFKKKKNQGCWDFAIFYLFLRVKEEKIQSGNFGYPKVGTLKGHNILSFLARKRRLPKRYVLGVSQSWDFAIFYLFLRVSIPSKGHLLLSLFQQRVYLCWNKEGTEYFIFSCA